MVNTFVDPVTLSLTGVSKVSSGDLCPTDKRSSSTVLWS